MWFSVFLSLVPMKNRASLYSNIESIDTLLFIQMSGIPAIFHLYIL